jgi:hypothetical protein
LLRKDNLKDNNCDKMKGKKNNQKNDHTVSRLIV